MAIQQLPTPRSGIPTGAAGDRPAAPSIGDVFYNGTDGVLEIYDGTQWIPCSAPPALPSISVVDVGTNAAYGAAQAAVTFTPSSSAGGKPLGYTASASTGGYTATTTGTTVVITVGNNGSWTFTGTAYNDFGTSVTTPSSTVTLTTVPQAPTIGTASTNAGTSDISLTWTLGNNGGKNLTAITITPYLNGTTAQTPVTAATTTATSATITGLTGGSSYTFKVKATNANGTGLESAASNSVTIPVNFTVDYLVVAGGGPGGAGDGNSDLAYTGGGGAGGLRCTVTATGGGGSLPSALTLGTGTSYTVTVGAGGSPGSNGSSSVFFNINTVGGGRGGFDAGSNFWNAQGGGSGGGGGMSNSQNAGAVGGGAGTAGEGYAGGNTPNAPSTVNYRGSAGGGGAANIGVGPASTNNSMTQPDGGNGITTNITGTSLSFGGGGGGSAAANVVPPGNGGNGGGGAGGRTDSGNSGKSGVSGTANTGGGGGGQAGSNNVGSSAGSGGSGVVILRYPDTRTITVGNGLTATTNTSGNNKVTRFNAGTGTVSWS